MREMSPAANDGPLCNAQTLTASRASLISLPKERKQGVLRNAAGSLDVADVARQLLVGQEVRAKARIALTFFLEATMPHHKSHTSAVRYRTTSEQAIRWVSIINPPPSSSQQRCQWVLLIFRNAPSQCTIAVVGTACIAAPNGGHLQTSLGHRGSEQCRQPLRW
jgi:hypothetical protein